MPEGTYELVDLCNADFRPNRAEAASMFRSYVREHIAHTQPDSHPFDQDLLEFVLDARMFGRGFTNKLHAKWDAQGWPERNSKPMAGVFANYLEHAMICAAINKVHPEYNMQPVLGRVFYHWHNGEESVNLAVGAFELDHDKKRYPAVWSESVGTHWDWQAELNRTGCMPDVSDMLPPHGGHTPADRQAVADILVPDEPLRIDTMLWSLVNEPSRDPAQSINPHRAVLHPIYRELCGPAVFMPAGGLSVSLYQHWYQPAKEHADVFVDHRLCAYRAWRGED